MEEETERGYHQQGNAVPVVRWAGRGGGAALCVAVSEFENVGRAPVGGVHPLGAGPAEGAALVEFELEGLRFTALDGGPMYKLTPAVSFVVSCESQEEIDHYWVGLSEGGEEQQCGWVTDRFGLTWQVAPAELGELMARAAGPVMEALLGMGRIELEGLRAAAGGGK